MEPTVKKIIPKLIRDYPAQYYRDYFRPLTFRVLHLLPDSWVKNPMHRPERVAFYHHLKQILLHYIR